MKEITEKTDARTIDESTLLRLAKEGNQPAFTQLIQLHQKHVFRLAFGFFHDKDDAMEIVQETFIRVYRKLDDFGENDAPLFGRWVNRIAHNLCIDYYRKFKKQKVNPKEIFDFETDSRTISTRHEDHLDIQSFKDSLEKSIDKLPKRQKSIFILKHFSGLKHHEISDTLDISVGTIKSLYHRSVQQLKKHLQMTVEPEKNGAKS